MNNISRQKLAIFTSENVEANDPRKIGMIVCSGKEGSVRGLDWEHLPQSNTECTGGEGVVPFLLMHYNEYYTFDIGIDDWRD
ncbi:MAG: hypothetical protein J6386_23670 [Candidatus Synoicihabitans palmerolidicus]|nr:hypothetical protein [Candidatus Synoicihabitans palmerolidicus]